jgi:hypothetical protein
MNNIIKNLSDTELINLTIKMKLSSRLRDIFCLINYETFYDLFDKYIPKKIKNDFSI